MPSQIKILCFAVCASASLLWGNALAATQLSADVEPGHRLGLGLMGAAYDIGLGPVGLGFALNTREPQSLLAGNFRTEHMQLRYSLRGIWRIAEIDSLAMGVLAGIHLDPGQAGERPGITPELGMGVAWDLRSFDLPFALRLNLSVGIHPYRPSSWQQNDTPPTLLQRLGLGPATSLEAAWFVNDNTEVTLGGGTLVGLRLKI